MKTEFSLAQLADPDLREADKILRACVHCGFCTATCPTYVELGDELDSPRGRIYLIKEMLEKDAEPTAEVVKHIDRCLSCLACMTTCPSGVHYMHLVDQARIRIEQRYRRSLGDRLMRRLLASVLPSPQRFRLALRAAALARPIIMLLRAFERDAGPRRPNFLNRFNAMLHLAPLHLTRAVPRAGKTFAALRTARRRVVLLQGCAQQVLAPEINEAAIALLTRHGVEVVLARDEGCCGSLTHHLGRDDQALTSARRNVDVWTKELDGEGLDAILVTTSGCGTTIKDYGYLLREDASYAMKAARISALAKDISEFAATLDLAFPLAASGLVVAYHAACSLQHGQKITTLPKELLFKCGFVVKDVAEGHLCCGSAGTYNILEPQLARRLRERKVANIMQAEPDVIAAGNIGCLVQIENGMRARGCSVPLLHTIELIDWATGGTKPRAMAERLNPRPGEGP